MATKKSVSKVSEEIELKEKIHDFLKSPKVLIPAVIILFLASAFIFIELSEDGRLFLSKNDPYEKQIIVLNSLSKSSFEFINNFRQDSNVSSLVLSESAYLIALDMSKQKEYDNELFRRTEDTSEFIRYTRKLSNYSIKYVVIYELETPGESGFKNAFNKLYTLKNTIKLEKYTDGAIGCSDKYCILIILGKEEIELKKDYY